MIDEADKVEPETVPETGASSRQEGAHRANAALMFACLALVIAMVGVWVALSAKDAADEAHAEAKLASAQTAANEALLELQVAGRRLNDAVDAATERGDNPVACVVSDGAADGSVRVVRYDEDAGWVGAPTLDPIGYIPNPDPAHQMADVADRRTRVAAWMDDCADSLLEGPADVVLGLNRAETPQPQPDDLWHSALPGKTVERNSQ